MTRTVPPLLYLFPAITGVPDIVMTLCNAALVSIQYLLNTVGALIQIVYHLLLKHFNQERDVFISSFAN